MTMCAQFCHLPLLLNPDKTKLSKRHGDVAVEDFQVGNCAGGCCLACCSSSPALQAKGFLPEAINNFVALLGWNPKTAQDVFTMKELEQQVRTTTPDLPARATVGGAYVLVALCFRCCLCCRCVVVCQFSLEHVNKANCVAASHRLEWLNAQHIKRAAEADPDRLLALALPFVQQEVDVCAARAGTTALRIRDSDEARRVLGVSIQLQHVREQRDMGL